MHTKATKTCFRLEVKKILYSSAHYCLSWVLCTVLEYQKYRYMLMIFKKALKDMNIKCCFQKQFKWKKRLWSHTHSCSILLKQLFITWTLTNQCQLDATRIFQCLFHIFQLNRYCRKKSHQVKTKLIQKKSFCYGLNYKQLFKCYQTWTGHDWGRVIISLHYFWCN